MYPDADIPVIELSLDYRQPDTPILGETLQHFCRQSSCFRTEQEDIAHYVTIEISYNFV